jgi:L-threonylcarbamoyladenylate synthase
MNSGIAILRTDTLYGIVGRAQEPSVVERIYTIKKRAPSKPLIILIANQDDIHQFKVVASGDHTNLINKKWPGPVSIIFSLEQPNDYEYLHRGTQTLAFRLPDDERLRMILKETGPLVAPSANPEGFEPAYTIQEAMEYFSDTVDCYCDDGPVTNTKASTVISCEDGKITILRA